MKLTIIVDDKAVYVDGVMRVIDTKNCGISSNIHALQWMDDSGWIEYSVGRYGKKADNKPITEIPEWANNCYIEWQKLESPVV